VSDLQIDNMENIETKKNLRELLVNSDFVLSQIDSDVTNIRLAKLCNKLNIGFKNILLLFEDEGISIKLDPNLKISYDLLQQIILKTPEISSLPPALDAIDSTVEYEEINIPSALVELHDKIANIDDVAYTKSVVLNQFTRNEYIREFVLLRAEGICELCENKAPFFDKYGNPFLETHHVEYLSKGGKDSIENVVALCPNCHRRIHNLKLESDIDFLKQKLKTHIITYRSALEKIN